MAKSVRRAVVKSEKSGRHRKRKIVGRTNGGSALSSKILDRAPAAERSRAGGGFVLMEVAAGRPIARPVSPERDDARLVDMAKKPQLARVVAHLMDKVQETHGDLSAREATRAIEIIDDALPATSGTPESDLGPFYSTSGLTRRWGMSRQAVHKRARAGKVLAVPVNDGSTAIPAFQFRNPESPRPDEVMDGIPQVIDLLTRAGRAPLGIAAWLVAPDERLGGLSAAEWLRRKRPVGTVMNAARSDVTRWQR